jgi:hypothetical protein
VEQGKSGASALGHLGCALQGGLTPLLGRLYTDQNGLEQPLRHGILLNLSWAAQLK